MDGTAVRNTAIKIDAPTNRKLFLILGPITLVIIILILIAVLVMFFTRTLLFQKWKHPPAPSAKQASSYCPNGCPEADTGLPKNHGTVPDGISSKINGNLDALKPNAQSFWSAV